MCCFFVVLTFYLEDSRLSAFLWCALEFHAHRRSAQTFRVRFLYFLYGVCSLPSLWCVLREFQPVHYLEAHELVADYLMTRMAFLVNNGEIKQEPSIQTLYHYFVIVTYFGKNSDICSLFICILRNRRTKSFVSVF